MSLMKRFQEKKKEDPGYGEGASSFAVLGTMPTTAIAKQQTLTGFEKELEDDLAKLKLIRSRKQKEAEKAAHLVPKYLPVVETLKASGSDHPLLGQILVWLFDIADIHGAMALALYCIEHGVPMPERFRRDLPIYLCDTITEWAEGEQDAGRSVEPYFGQVCELAEGWDIPDEVSAKMLKLKGLVAMDLESWSEAITHFERAEEYGAKVKTVLGKARKKLESAKPAEEKPAEPAEASGAEASGTE
ncbi:phage terminase small subunit [Desulfoluna spongiiphila]|uniref:Phage small terminase subunit n=1 Tax=Desulfoluna spongiiphila TaxID=419481 RepID=A0A1G5G5S4_9BACT|nr:phage terminase small subunit [Desulfoluna spongiiphila]SCY46088.1 Phage small terminase subunit [Desulfoluna spongiiphila]